jgi:O-antigen/teichoic acid export membrane protein
MGSSSENHSQLRAGVILNYLNIGLGALIPVLYTPIMLSLLGQSEYGLYKLSSSLAGYISLVSLGMGTAVTRYLIKAREEEGTEGEERVLGLFVMFFRIVAMASLIIGAVLLLCVNLWYGSSLSVDEVFRMRILIGIMALNTALTLLISPYVSVVTANERFVFIQWMNIASTCLIPLVNLLVLYLGYASIGMAISSLVIQLVIRVLYLNYSKSYLNIRPRFTKPKKGFVKEIMIFALWIFIGEIVDKLYGATDMALIGAVPALSTEGVAVYNIGTVFSGIVLTVAVGISGLMAPRTNKMVFSGASADELTDFGIRIGRIQALVIGLIVSGFIAFGKPFIHFYAGDSFFESYWVALLVMIPYLIPIVQSVFLNVVVAENRHRFRSLVYLGIALLNVIGTWIFIHRIGVIGAAMVSGIALIIGPGLIMNRFYSKIIGLQVARFWRNLSPIYLVSFLLSVGALLIGKYLVDYYQLPVLLMGIVVYSVIYLIICWMILMNDYEKAIVKDLIHLR